MRNCRGIVCPEKEDLVCAKPIKGGVPTTFMNSCLVTVAECNTMNNGKKCKRNCGDTLDPVCARPKNPQTFKNRCILEHKECKSKDKYIIVSEGECPITLPDYVDSAGDTSVNPTEDPSEDIPL
ncbi:unnamed protein product [Diamesa serratosioi]